MLPGVPHDPARLVPGHRQQRLVLILRVLQDAVQLRFGRARIGQINVVTQHQHAGVIGKRIAAQMPFGMDVAPVGELCIDMTVLRV
ncbi:hypothetical protein [Xanthomonas vesicatoria]|uniref:hypothetical protein n=1 Tax=Xanthomonas vesicatoria TaxID=56460 RepID=UPI001E38EF13|nr:hypothetical protein [Xanthomonas vesicatoria]